MWVVEKAVCSVACSVARWVALKAHKMVGEKAEMTAEKKAACLVEQMAVYSAGLFEHEGIEVMEGEDGGEEREVKYKMRAWE